MVARAGRAKVSVTQGITQGISGKRTVLSSKANAKRVGKLFLQRVKCHYFNNATLGETTISKGGVVFELVHSEIPERLTAIDRTSTFQMLYLE